MRENTARNIAAQTWIARRVQSAVNNLAECIISVMRNHFGGHCTKQAWNPEPNLLQED